MRILTYNELRRLETFDERFKYLKLRGSVGAETFGFDRYLNQMLYTSREWQNIRSKVILRDGACDLGVPGYEIVHHILIHHMNPISPEDIKRGNKDIFDPEFLICTTQLTHRAIHYGDESLLPKAPIVRRPNDTTLWRQTRRSDGR